MCCEGLAPCGVLVKPAANAAFDERRGSKPLLCEVLVSVARCMMQKQMQKQISVLLACYGVHGRFKLTLDAMRIPKLSLAGMSRTLVTKARYLAE
jgi:hypothetical protein